MEYSHLPRNSFLHQDQKHQYINCNNLTLMNTLENFVLLLVKSHILENAEYLASG